MPDEIVYWDQRLQFKVFSKKKSIFGSTVTYTKFIDVKTQKYLFSIEGDMYDPYLSKKWWRDKIRIEFDAIERKEEIDKKDFI